MMDPTSFSLTEMPYDDLDERGLPARIAGWAYGTVLGLLFGWPFGYVLVGARGLWLVVFVVLFMFAAGYTIMRITTIVPEGVANAFVYMLWPSGNSTPYAPTFSMEQAMVARGDIEGALSRYGMAMRMHPTDAELRFRAAEVLFRSSTPAKAATYFIEGRHLAGENRARELYATQRLIDLYLGPSGNPVGALVELTRLVDRFPGTREAEAAANVITRLKHSPVES